MKDLEESQKEIPKITSGELEQLKEVNGFMDMICREVVNIELRKSQLLQKLTMKMDYQNDLQTKIGQRLGIPQGQKFQINMESGEVVVGNQVMINGRVDNGQ